MQQKRSLIFQGFSRKVDNFYRFSVQLNAEFRVKASACKYSYFKKALGRVKSTPSQSGPGNSEPSETLPEHENIRGKESYQ